MHKYVGFLDQFGIRLSTIVGCFVYDELRVPEDDYADAKEQLNVHLVITVPSHV